MTTLKKILKELVVYVSTYTGLLYVMRNVINKKKLTVLLYHEIGSDLFESHLKILKKKYNIIALKDLDSKGELPDRPLIITFDDGHKSNYGLNNAIKLHQTPVTIFITTGLIDTNKRFWFNVVKSFQELLSLMKEENANRESLLELKGFNKDKEYGVRQVLSKDEIIEMSCDFVNFQPHTEYHPALTQCDDETSYNEISNSVMQLHNKFIFELHSFAPPFGKYGEREISTLKRLGIRNLLTTEPGLNLNFSNKDSFRTIKRIGITDNSSAIECLFLASGIWDIIRNLPFINKLSSFNKMDELT